jgi:hypothetical protein
MVVMRLLMLVLVAGCWRGGPAPTTTLEEPVSFIVQVNGLAELERSTAVLETNVAIATKRLLGLADEAEREALRADLRMLADDLDRLAARARTAHARNADAAALAQIDRKLADATIALANLRHALRYAKTLEQLQANLPVEAPELLRSRHIGIADLIGP